MSDASKLAAAEDLGDAEVEDLDEVRIVVAALEMDVRRLEIAVHDAERVRFLERLADLARDLRDRASTRTAPSALVALEQALAVEQLHHDEQRAVGGLAELVRGDRVRVAQAVSVVALAAKPREHAEV